MTFARKIFIAVFLSTLIIGSLLTWSAHRYVESRAESDFIGRYTAISKILGDSLTRLDANTEALMMNAAQVVIAEDKAKGLLSTDELRQLQRKLGVTHLFVIKKNGDFIRSTNEDPANIPNLFSFSPRYKKLLTGELQFEATPIIKPNPEPKPYKFLSVANVDRSRIIEVGIRLDFIANTLVEAVSSDKSVLSMALHAPDGTTFGTFSPSNVVLESQKVDLPESLEQTIDDGSSIRFFTKVRSSHPQCGQCDVSGTSVNGEYYYVLESRVSKAELTAIQTKASYIFMLVGLGNLLLSWLLARFLSRRLVRNIETAVARVRSMKEGDLKGRINLQADDEVSFLTQEFDRLLESLEESQRKLIEAEMVRSKVELARVVAHNIRSPILAIEMMLPTLLTVPESTKRVLRSSVNEIKQLSEKLKVQADGMIEQTHLDNELVSVPIFLQDFVNQKRMEISAFPNIRITLDCSESDPRALVRASSCELTGILSNLVNNAVDAYGSARGVVSIRAKSDAEKCMIVVLDQAGGMPDGILEKLGTAHISTKHGRGRGIGLFHAKKSVEQWLGDLKVESKNGAGTEVVLVLPIFRQMRAPSISEPILTIRMAER